MSRSLTRDLMHSAVLVAGLIVPCLVQAADLPVALPPEPVLEAPVAIGAAWYLRGDVGVGAASIHEMHTYVPGGHLPDDYEVKKAGISDQFFAGAGVGVQVTPFLRGDITGEYRGGAKIHAWDRYTSYEVNGVPVYGINKYDGNLSSVVVLANGYFDLGTWYGLTPFIGAGVGTAFHHVSGFYDSGFGAASGGFGSAKDRWSNGFAWALHAGVGWNVTPDFVVEVGYRYLNAGSAKTAGVDCVNDPGCGQAYYKIKNIESHDVRIGLRYLIGGGVAAPLPPVYAPGPVVSKY